MQTQISWETEIAAYLNELSRVQDEVLAMLARKRELLVAGNGDGLAALAEEEGQLVARLQQCLVRRKELLAQAQQEGKPNTSLQALAARLPRAEKTSLDPSLRQATARARLLRHQSLANWVIIQRTLLHLSQLLEIIATGGRLQPTYGGGEAVQPSGGLVDQAA